MLTHFITTQAKFWLKTTIIETILRTELLLHREKTNDDVFTLC